MITLDDEIREMEHELARRRRVYDRLIAERKMFRSDADRTLAVLQAILSRLKADCWRCRICGGLVDLTNAERPSAHAGPGGNHG